jgi:hypothetical protein
MSTWGKLTGTLKSHENVRCLQLSSRQPNMICSPLELITVRFVNSKPLDDLESHGIIEFAKIENGVPALQVSDIWHKIKGHIGPNLAFLYGGHDLGRRATKKNVLFY